MTTDKLRPGRVGGYYKPGERVLTASGRLTSPYPKVDLTTLNKASRTLRAAERWLIQEAIDEAHSRGDHVGARRFVNCLEAPERNDRIAADEYLFGHQDTTHSAVPPGNR